MSTIYILWLRQLKRYFRSRSRILGSIGQPLLFLVAFGFGFQPIYEKAGGGKYLEFLAPGIIAMGVLFMAVASGVEIIWDKQFGFLKETLVAPVSRVGIMLGRTLGGATVAALQGMVIFILTLVVGFRPVVSASYFSYFLALLFVVLTALLFTALGTAIGSLLDDMQGFHLIMNLLVQPIFFLSGALFPLAGLPQLVWRIAMIDPLAYGVDGIRGALVNGSHFGLLTDFTVLSVVSVVFLIIGSYLFKKIQI